MRAPRSVPALLLALAAAGCGDEAPGPAVVLLTSRAELARLEIEAPWVPPAGEVRWVREGLAGLAVPIVAAEGRAEPLGEERVLVSWPLPHALADGAGRGDAQPVLEGVAVTTPIVPGLEPDPSATSGFFVDGARLTIVHPAGEELPERFAVIYPVWAAALAGSAHAAGFPPEELLRVTRLHGDRATLALALPAAPAERGGASLRVPLDEVPGARLRATLEALALPGEEAPVHVELRARGRLLASVELVPGAAPLPVGDGRGVELPEGGPAVLELTARGPSGSVVFLGAPAVGRPRLASDGPNVLLVLVDTLRADRLGAYGSERGLSPALDRLAAESLLFEQCWSASSWTLPSVATIFTSTHGGEHLAWLDDQRLGRGLDTLAEVMARSGRHTAAFTDGAFLSPYFGLERGFALWDASGGGVEPVARRAREHLASLGDEPWFVVLHTYQVHAPYEPPPAASAAVAERHPGALLGRTPEPHRFYELTEDGTPIPVETARALEALYDEEVRVTDHVLGAFLDELRASGALDHTLVCLTADHGEEFGEHGLLGHGDTLYREQLHVPFLLRFPDGRHAGRRDERPVSLVDLAPTLLDAIGRADLLPATSFGGRSLLADAPPSPVYAVRNQHGFGLLELLREDQRVSIRGELFRPQPRPSDAPWQFYDLDLDPLQSQPASEDPADPAFADLAERLRRASERYGRPRVEGAAASPDARTHAALRHLGYAGDE